MDLPTGTATEIEIVAWATPAEGITLDELIEEFKELGNPILEIDRINNKIKVVQNKQKIN